MSGRKYDNDKAPVGRGFLGYFRRAVEVVANVSKFGKEKYETEYEEKNWMQVDGARLRYRDAAARHLALDAGGEYADPESGLPHVAHAAWCMLASLELDKIDEHGTELSLQSILESIADAELPDCDAVPADRRLEVGDRVRRIKLGSYTAMSVDETGTISTVDNNDSTAFVHVDQLGMPTWVCLDDLEYIPQ